VPVGVRARLEARDSGEAVLSVLEAPTR